jgi:RNA polymerase sigma-70 factor (ECF subfamily)
MDGIAQDIPRPIVGTARQPAATQPARDQAFAALVDRHTDFLYRVAFRLLGNVEDAEDAVQDTFLKLYQTDAWQQMIDEKAYLARAVWRTGLDRRTTAEARAMKHFEDVTELDVAHHAPTPEQTAVSNSDHALLKTLVQALPDELRQPLILSAIDEIKSHEVGAILGIPAGTVRSRVNNAKDQLRKKFLATKPREARS